MKTGDLAKRLNVHANTLRKWGAEAAYAPFLSAEARGRAPGAKRRFTDQDALVLATIAYYRDLGLRSAQIVELLQSGKLLDALPETASPQETAARESIALVAMPEYTRVLDLLNARENELGRVIVERDKALTDKDAANARIADLQREIGQLQGRLETLDRERRPADYWMRVLLIVIIGLLIVGVVAVLYLATMQR